MESYPKQLQPVPHGRSFLTEWVYSICIGLFGSVLLLMFATFFLTDKGVLALLPWAIGFNGLLTGHALVNKTENRFSRRKTWLAGGGLFMALPLFFIVNLMPFFPFYISERSFVLYLPVAILCSLSGGWIASKTIRAKNLEKRG